MNAVSLPVWVWLFPATFALHILEEGLAGETFGRWIGHVVGRQLGQRPFFAANGVLLLAMMLFIRITQGLADQAWLAAMLGALVTANGLGHLTGTIIVRIYSPGLYTCSGSRSFRAFRPTSHELRVSPS